jgi:hypothetical protein
MRVESSPFVIAGPAPAGELVGRHDVLAAIAERAARGRFVLLTAPRRYGKTTLVRRLQHDAATSRDNAVVIVDLLGVQTHEDIALRMVQAWTRLPEGVLSKAAAKVLPFVSGITLAGGVVSVGLRSPAVSDRPSLEAVLDIPRAVAERSGIRILVVLDEFQAIAEVARADAIIRSQIQHHTDTVSYLFCGSEQSTTEMLFTDRARPLYGQAERIELGPFDPDALADYVDSRFADSRRGLTAAALAAYLDVVAGHPQRAMLVADAMWRQVDEGAAVDRPEVSAAIDDALSRCVDEFTATLNLLSDAQARTARLVAWGEPLTGAAAQRLSLPQGSARSAAAALSDRGLLRAVDRRYVHVDPLFAEWFRRLGTKP